MTVSVLERSQEENIRRRPLYGPLPWHWLLPALRRPARAAHVAMLLWLQAGWERSAEISLTADLWSDFGLCQQSVSRGLAALEAVGLVAITRRAKRAPGVTILDIPRVN